MDKVSFSFYMLVHGIPKCSHTYRHVCIHRITEESKKGHKKEVNLRVGTIGKLIG